MLEQREELGTRVRTVGRHHDSPDLTDRAFDAENDGFVAGVRVALEPERVPHDELGGFMGNAAGVTPHRRVRDGEVAPVAVRLQKGDGFGHGRGGLHGVQARTRCRRLGLVVVSGSRAVNVGERVNQGFEDAFGTELDSLLDCWVAALGSR